MLEGTKEQRKKLHSWVILDRLTDVILENVKGCIVDIGIGYSSVVLAGHSRRLNREHHSIDTNTHICNFWKDDLASYNHHLHNCLSSTFMKNFTGTPAIVFIDGNHKVDVVRSEFDFFFEKLVIGGVIFLHDTLPWEGNYEKKLAKGKEMNTYRLRKELEPRLEMEVFTWPYTAAFCGLTMVLKKDMEQPFYRI